MQPKYIIVSRKIEEAIDKGIYKNKLPGVYLLAKEYNTTHITVSKAIHYLEKKGVVVIQSTRGTFIPASGKRRLHRLIGVVGMHTIWHGQELAYIEKLFKRKRFNVIAFANTTDLKKLLEEQPDMLGDFSADAYIFAYSTLSTKIAFDLKRKGIPFVSLNKIPDVQGINWVDFDTEAGLEDALMMFAKYDHKYIAYCGFHNQNYGFSTRMYNIYKNFMVNEINFFDKRLFLEVDSFDTYLKKYPYSFIENAAKDIVSYFSKLDIFPTALFIQDRLGEAVIKEFEKYGTKIPQDLSVIGVTTTKRRVNFSTVHYNNEEKLKAAVELILHIVELPDRETKHILIKNENIRDLTVLRLC